MRRAVDRLALLALTSLFFVPAAVRAQDVARFYEERCAVCHTIGGGDQAGPDLNGSTERKDRDWIVRFLLDPEGVVASGDEYAVRLVKTWGDFIMPATDGLTRQMAEELVEYIEKESRDSHRDRATPAPAVVAFTPDDRIRGFEIFTGRTALANAGPSCVSCHALGSTGGIRGGRLGPDLGAVHTRLGGATGTMAWLARPPTPLMRAVYRGATFNDDETRALAALFESTATATTVPATDARPWLLLTGLAATILALAAMAVAWRDRFRSVRRRLVDRREGKTR